MDLFLFLASAAASCAMGWFFYDFFIESAYSRKINTSVCSVETEENKFY